jgi:hypothetical protein
MLPSTKKFIEQLTSNMDATKLLNWYYNTTCQINTMPSLYGKAEGKLIIWIKKI